MSLKIILSVYSFVISIHFFYLILRKNLKPKEVDCRFSCWLWTNFKYFQSTRRQKFTRTWWLFESAKNILRMYPCTRFLQVWKLNYPVWFSVDFKLKFYSLEQAEKSGFNPSSIIIQLVFCLGRLKAAQGSKGKKVDLSFSEQLLRVVFSIFVFKKLIMYFK